MSTAEHRGGRETYTPVEESYVAMQESADFQELRKRYRGWVLPVAAGSLVWYFAYVLLTTYAPGFMSERLVGNINVGLVAGLLQFVSTFAITMWYVSYANRRLDPIAANLRHELEEAAPEVFVDPSGGKK